MSQLAPKPSITIRPHRREDIASMSDIRAECGTRDTLTRYLMRDMDKYSTSYRRSFRGHMRGIASGAGKYTFVAVMLNHASPGQEIVVGYVTFSRIGKSAAAKKWQDSPDAQNGVLWNFERSLLGMEAKYADVFTGVNPTKNPANRKNVQSIMHGGFPEDLLPEVWQVGALYVHPEHQRQGIARALMQWGFDTAREENVPIGVKGSAIGAQAYRAMGFQSVGEEGFSDWFDELAFGGEKHQMWLWVPESGAVEVVEKVRKRRSGEGEKDSGTDIGEPTVKL